MTDTIEHAIPAADANPADVATASDDAAVPAANPVDVTALLLRLAVVQMSRHRASVDFAVAKEKEADLRAQVVTHVARGTTLPVIDPVGHGEIASITVSKTVLKAEIVDEAATEEWVKAKYREKIVKRLKLAYGYTLDDALKVLAEARPFMVEEVEEIPAGVFRDLELKSQKAKVPMGWGGETGKDAPPGIRMFRPESTVRVTFAESAAEVVGAMLADRVVDKDGNLIGRDGGVR
jgi:hypothetical protein